MTATKGSRKRYARRATLTQPMMRRIVVIHAALGRAPRIPVNCSGLACELEVDRKTVHRDILSMQNDLGLPIEYDESRHSYYYTRPVAELPLFKLTEGELLALFVAERAMSGLKGTPIGGKVQAALGKLAAGLPDEVSVSWGEIDEMVSFRQSGVAVADAEVFADLERAVRQRREVAFEYRKLDSSRYGVRHVRPFHLGHIDGAWYLFGYDLKRQADRTFALVRVRSLEVRRRTFPAEEAERFSVGERLRDSFGVFASGRKAPYRIRVRFSGLAARLVAERQWHPSQRIQELSGGEIEAEFRLNNLFEVKRWVLSWGREAEVLAPKALIKMVAER